MDDQEDYNSEDDEEIPGDLELNEEERAMLEMADLDDIEDLAEETQQKILAGKKRKKPVEI